MGGFVKPCTHCGKPHTPRYHTGRRSYCSATCRNVYKNEQRSIRRAAARLTNLRTCHCGNTFPPGNNRKYCSDACRDKAHGKKSMPLQPRKTQNKALPPRPRTQTLTPPIEAALPSPRPALPPLQVGPVVRVDTMGVDPAEIQATLERMAALRETKTRAVSRTGFSGFRDTVEVRK